MDLLKLPVGLIILWRTARGIQMTVPKLTTKAACRVAKIDRDRLNEHIAAGAYDCAPDTIPGRARLFDPNDMIGLWLFRELMQDGFDARAAGKIACSVMFAARETPSAPAISYVQDYFIGGRGFAVPFDMVPPPSDWETNLFCPGGTDARKVTTFNIAKLRKIIAHYTDEERSIIGEDD
jgi:hypothetical protein